MNAIDETLNEAWESGSLGRDRAHMRRASAEVEAQVDQALAMKLITMRLPIPMIEALKAVAQYYGIGYQPMVRDLIGRFIASEIPTILSEIEHRAAAVESEKTAPVDNFVGRKRAV